MQDRPRRSPAPRSGLARTGGSSGQSAIEADTDIQNLQNLCELFLRAPLMPVSGRGDTRAAQPRLSAIPSTVSLPLPGFDFYF